MSDSHDQDPPTWTAPPSSRPLDRPANANRQTADADEDARSTLATGADEDGRLTLARPPADENDVTRTVPGGPAAASSSGPSSGPSSTAPPSESVSRFEIRAELGAGAFGVVYQVYDPLLDRMVALKVARPETLDSPSAVDAFRREAKAAAGLRHPNIVPVFETGTVDGRQFIAAAFISGRTLARELEDHDGPMGGRRAAELARPLADALDYAHRHGVVHRDVKPANVMIDEHGEPLLVDFGIAARGDAGSHGLGTPAYMAPEQGDGDASPACDQYSLGCVLYELVTGDLPFAGGPDLQLVLHKTRPAPAPRSRNRAVHPDLNAIVMRCLAKDPAKRYPSCGDLADDLRRFLAGDNVSARRLGLTERAARWARRSPYQAATAGVAIALTAAVVLALTFWARSSDQALQIEMARLARLEQTDGLKDRITALHQAADERAAVSAAAPGSAAGASGGGERRSTRWAVSTDTSPRPAHSMTSRWPTVGERANVRSLTTRPTPHCGRPGSTTFSPTANRSGCHPIRDSAGSGLQRRTTQLSGTARKPEPTYTR